MPKRLQETMKPVFPVDRVGLVFTDEGVIDVLHISSDQHEALGEDISKIIRRRFPDGNVKWFEEVL